MLIVGCERGSIPTVPRELVQAMARQGIVVNTMDNFNAAATFNLLNQESRPVAAALFPAASV